MSGEFSFKRFCKRLRIPKGERSLVEDLFARGLEKYYYDLYGYDKYGPHPEFLINERMGEPYIFGYGAVQVLRHADISDDTKRRMAEYTLSIVRPRVEYGVPFPLLPMSRGACFVFRHAPRPGESKGVRQAWLRSR